MNSMDTLPENIPTSIINLLDSIVESCKKTLGENLIGVYLHGSAAMGCFNPLKSDIDLLIVVKERLPVEQKREIIDFILQLVEKAPPKGLELSVVTQDALQHFQYPIPYELHFSNSWKEAYIAGQVDYDKQRFDLDLAAHFTVTKKRGIRLYGEPIQAVFPALSEGYYLRSILSDASDIFERITDDPIYGILNLCRVLAFLRERAVYSKLEGGQWGLQHIEAVYRPLIQKALEVYQSESQHSAQWDKAQLEAFASYMKQQIEPPTLA